MTIIDKRQAVTRGLAVAGAALALAGALAPSASCGGGTGGAGGAGGTGATGGYGGTGGQDGGLATCQGEPHTLSIGAPLTVMSATQGADRHHSTCGDDGSTGPEVIYQITVAEAGTLSGQLLNVDGGLEGVLYVESTCGDTSTTRACASGGVNTGGFRMAVATGETVFVFVDGDHGTQGGYTLLLDLEAPQCGDGVVNTNACSNCDAGPACAIPGCEQCDYGAIIEDGCDEMTCLFAAPADDPSYQSDVCPGSLIALHKATPVSKHGTTVGYHDNYQAPCQALGGGPDRVYGFVAADAGTLTVTATPHDFDLVLSVYASCGTQPPLTYNQVQGVLCCSDGDHRLAVESVSLPVTVGTSYYVVVDGYNAGNYGVFELEAKIE